MGIGDNDRKLDKSELKPGDIKEKSIVKKVKFPRSFNQMKAIEDVAMEGSFEIIKQTGGTMESIKGSFNKLSARDEFYAQANGETVIKIMREELDKVPKMTPEQIGILNDKIDICLDVLIHNKHLELAEEYHKPRALSSIKKSAEEKVIGKLLSWDSGIGRPKETGYAETDIILDTEEGDISVYDIVTDTAFNTRTKEEFEKQVQEANQNYQKEFNINKQFVVKWRETKV